jgi:NAD-dependent SIR2 family protein deacetylase
MDEHRETPKNSPPFNRAAARIAQADTLLITAGAGMGVDSGLPDFRGKAGFWQAYPALARAGIAFEEIANPQAFLHNPELAWGFYGHRLNLYRATTPHAGYDMLRQWINSPRLKLPGFVFTSNVDGHFAKAGFDPSRMVECHGSLHHFQCSAPCHDEIDVADGFVPVVDEVNCKLTSTLPRCKYCGAINRPNVLMFNDGQWVEHRAEAQMARFTDWLSQADGLAIVVIELGAGPTIATVRRVGEHLSRQPGCALIRINPRDAGGVREEDVALEMGALAGIEAIAQVLAENQTP